MPSRITAVSAKKQRELASAIKRARFLALLPYIVELRSGTMADVELILLQRVEKLGQMGEVVKVKPGFARNFLLPQKKALRATKDNLRPLRAAARPARGAEPASAARRPSGSPSGSTGCRSSSSARRAKSGSLYGSVSARDIAEAVHGGGADHRPRAGRAGPADQDARPVHGCAWCCTRRCRSRSPSTSRAARKKPSGRRAASGSVPRPRRKRSQLDAAAMFEPGAEPEQPADLTRPHRRA